MALVESKRFLTKNIKIFFGFHFVFYMSSFYYIYAMHTAHTSTASWRILLLFVVPFGVFTSLFPAITREIDDEIRLDRKFNYGYLMPLFTLFMIFIYFVIKAYYYWSLSLNIDDLMTFFVAYLIISSSLCFSFLILKSTGTL